MAEVREEKKVVHVPKDALNSGVDTSEYLKEQLSLGLDYMFNLSTPVLPGDEAPLFEAPSLEKGVSKVTNLSELKVFFLNIDINFNYQFPFQDV